MNHISIEIPSTKETAYYSYFFYNTEGQIIYIGKTTRLKNRIRSHFSKDLLEVEPWRATIDRLNILTFKCYSLTDLELYETYFINKYKPTYNKDKVYNDLPSFELPHIEPTKYKFTFKFIKGQGTFADTCKTVLEDNSLYKEYPSIKNAVDILGSKKLKALKYRKSSIDKELLVTNQLENIEEILNLLDIKISGSIPKSTDITEYLKVKPSNRIFEGKSVNGYVIKDTL